MKVSAALCVNGFEYGAEFYPKEIAICDVNQSYNSVLYIKLGAEPPQPQASVFASQQKHIHSLGWSFPEGTIRFSELSIALRQIQQYFTLFVENEFVQRVLLDKFCIQTAVIPLVAIPVSKTVPTYCGIAQHNFGFVCAFELFSAIRLSRKTTVSLLMDVRNAALLGLLADSQVHPFVRKAILKTGNRRLINCVCECYLNIINGNVPV